MRTAVATVSLAAALLGGELAEGQVLTECFTEQAMQRPSPVVAGLTRTVLVSAGDQIMHESLFDGGIGNDPFSAATNALAGYTGCDGNPDVRAIWNYVFSDDNSSSQAIMTLTATAFSAQTASAPTGSTCTVATNSLLRIVQVDTGPVNSNLASFAGSVLFPFNLSGCDNNHDWFQARVRAVASTSQGGSVVDEGCFLVPFRWTPLPCPADAGGCL